MRRYFAAGMWLTLTVTATLIVWTAVSVVAADVTDRPAPVVAHHDVVVALAGGDQPTATTTTSPPTTVAIPPRNTPPTTAPRLVNPTTTTVPSPASSPVIPVVTTTTVSPPTTRAPVRPVAPTTTTAPAGGTATYSTDGGVVAVACTGFNTIRLVAALPYDGYQAVVLSSGPSFVSVSFATQGRSILVSAACFFGQPFEYTSGNGGPPSSTPSGPPTT